MEVSFFFFDGCGIVFFIDRKYVFYLNKNDNVRYKNNVKRNVIIWYI